MRILLNVLNLTGLKRRAIEWITVAGLGPGAHGCAREIQRLLITWSGFCVSCGSKIDRLRASSYLT
jgi:rRNA maturation endonuclease Nob1